MRLVLDTNVFISSLLNPNDKTSQIMKIILSYKADLIYNSSILCEYENVMLGRNFSDKINSLHIKSFINQISKIAIPFNPLPSKIKLHKEFKRIFFDTARDSGAILISCNLKNFPKKPFIMLPDSFLRQFLV